MITTYPASDGAILRYKHSGAGLPVVFLHPTPFSHAYWDLVTADLQRVWAIAPDLRGHGASELVAVDQSLPVGLFIQVPDAPVLTIAQLADDVLQLLDTLGQQRAVFVGCSIGGYVLLELWRRAPERMIALGFVCSKPQADSEAAVDRRRQTIERIHVEGVNGVLDGFVRALTGATSQARRPAILSELRTQVTLNAEAAIAVQAGLAVRPDSLATVATISVPVLAIAASEDSTCPQAEMEAFKAAPGGCEFHLLPDVGHLAAYEQPQQVAALLTPWLHQLNQ